MVPSFSSSADIPIGPGIGLLIHPDILDGEVVSDDLILFLTEDRSPS